MRCKIKELLCSVKYRKYVIRKMEVSSIVRFLVVLLSSVGIFLFYYPTLSPSIAGGDSGEIVAEGCHLGTAHPPGYPLMTVFVYFLSQLRSFGHTVAYWVNLSSAILTCGACLCMGLIVAEYSLSELGGSIVAMTLFAFSPLIWQYAVTAEVFPLNTFFAALILYLTIKFSKTQSSNIAILGAFVCGLALGNQHTIILYEVPLILWMLFLLRKRLYYQPKLLLSLSIAFIIGFMAYLYMPLAAIISPKAGSWGDVTSLTGFIHHFLRKDYGTFQLFSGKVGKQNENLWQRNNAFWHDFHHNQILYPFSYFLFIGIISSIIIGLWYDLSYQRKNDVIPIVTTNNNSKPSTTTDKGKKASKKTKTPTRSSITETDTTATTTEEAIYPLVSDVECKWTPLIIFLTEVFYFIVFHSLSNLPLSDRLLYGVHQRFWMQPMIVCCIWIGIGVNSIVLIIKTLFTARLPQTVKVAINALLTALLLLFAVYVSREQYQKNVVMSDQSDGWYFHNYAKALLTPLPLNSILLINYDQQWTSIRYLQVCEGYRPDVTTIQLSMMSYKWFQTKRQLYQNIPLYSTTKNNNITDSSIVKTEKREKTRSITFPGTYLTYFHSPSIKMENAFHLISLLNENSKNWNHQIYLGGKLGHFDQELSNYYELIPFGLLTQFYPQSLVSSFSPIDYGEKIMKSWNIVMENLLFPKDDKYPEETWEWTINRDFKDRIIGNVISPPLCISLLFTSFIIDSSSYFLSTAINIAATVPQPLVDALYFIETAYYLEGNETSPTSLYKNLGLAHVHLVQNKLLSEDIIPQPTKDIFQSLEKIGWPKDGR